MKHLFRNLEFALLGATRPVHAGEPSHHASGLSK